MAKKPPTKEDWKRAFGWQALLSMQVIAALVQSALISLVAYFCIWASSSVLGILHVDDPWIEPLKKMKGAGYILLFFIALVFDLIHIVSIHRDGEKGP